MFLIALFGGLFAAILFVDFLNSLWERGGAFRRILVVVLFAGAVVTGTVLV